MIPDEWTDIGLAMWDIFQQVPTAAPESGEYVGRHRAPEWPAHDADEVA